MTRRMTTRASAVAATILLLGAGQAVATRAARPHRAARAHRANTFSGSCALSGSVAFVPPLTNTPHPTVQHAQATGTCSGSFADRSGRVHQLTNAPVSYRAREYAPDASCDGGTDAGSGSMTFGYGTIRFTISETRVVVAAAVTLKGAKGGSALAQANPSPSANPMVMAQECASSGLGEAPIEAKAATTPSISG